MPRKRKGQTLPAAQPAKPKLSEHLAPIPIDPNALYSDVALTKLLHIYTTSLETLRTSGRLVPREISGTAVYVGADVLAYLRAERVAPDASRPDSSAA